MAELSRVFFAIPASVARKAFSLFFPTKRSNLERLTPMKPLNEKFALVRRLKEIRQDLYGQCGIESLAAALGSAGRYVAELRTGCDDARQSAPRISGTHGCRSELATYRGRRAVHFPASSVWIAAYQKSPLV